jgi:hydroxyacylglutathione hydrolase
MKVIPIDVPELGNRSYIVHDGSSAIVIDPSRKTKQIINQAKKAKVKIVAVFETHIHNDYVTGGFALAKELGCDYYVSAEEYVEFERKKIVHEETIKIGELEITALASPGHTHHHLSYLVVQKKSKPVLFSGGSLLYGAVGRTDLVSPESTAELAKAQYRTAQFFVDRLDPATELYPTHGFGSFCAATETEHISASTIKHQLKTNSAYTAENEASFVKELIKSLDAYPSYYAYMASFNLKGPIDPKLDSPKPLNKQAILRALHAGAAVIDMRSRIAYAVEHLPGSYNIELSNSLATYVGWLFAWETPVILVAASAKAISEAQEQLSLIGRDIISGKITPTELLKSNNNTASYAVRGFVDVPDALKNGNVSILDVRRRLEWEKGHIPKARHIPIHELINRINEIAKDKEVWVHCASGFRASIAASILSGNGYDVVLIDDNYENASKAGLIPIVKQKFVAEIIAGKSQLVDVREDSEWEKGHAKEALHMPLGRLLDNDFGELTTKKPTYIYCATGERSGMAENYLKQVGFEVINIGGLDDWIHAGGSIGY